MHRWTVALASLVASLPIASPSGAVVDSAVVARISAAAVPFVPNAGQWDARAAYGASMFAGTLFVTTDGQLVYRLSGARLPARDAPGAGGVVRRAPGWVATERFVGADHVPLAAKPRGRGSQPGGVGYATDKGAVLAVDSFERIDLGPVFAGVDVTLRATGTNVEKIFTVAARADPREIRVRVDGATSLAIDEAGSLVAATGNGPVAYTAPIAFQQLREGGRHDVAVSYVLDATAGVYGFAVGNYDRDLPLVIDPLLQSTLLGGTDSGVEDINGMAIHPGTGEVYVVGQTQATDFPGTAGGPVPTNAGGNKGFVSRFNAALTARLQSTYLGGTNSPEQSSGVAVHPENGDVYVTGVTGSGNFPGTTGGADATLQGTQDAYVARFNPALTTLIQSTYLGGESFDVGNAIAIHPVTGEVYVAGFTGSTLFPGRAGGAQAAKVGAAGPQDGFVSRLSADLTQIRQSTYFGGSGTGDNITALTINPVTGDVVIAGNTDSADLLQSAGGFQPVSAGGARDGFVARLNHALTSLEQTTYLGGNQVELVSGLATLRDGSVVVAVISTSPSIANLPGTLTGSEESLVVVLNGKLTALVGATRFGGSGSTGIGSIAVHPSTNEIYAGGNTTVAPFPVALAGGAQTTYAAGNEGFITRLDAAASAIQSTYFGALGDDVITALAVHPATGDIYSGGSTTSSALPGLSGGAQTTRVGTKDTFIARHTFDLRSAVIAQPAAFSFAPVFNAAPGSLQTSAPATITGLGVSPQPVALVGGNFARYCVSSAANCACDVQGFTRTAGPISNNQSVCVRQFAPPTAPDGTTVTLLVGGGSAPFFVGTAGCTLDVDGNGTQDALTDGLLVLRALLGLTGTAVTDNAVGPGASRTSWAQLRTYLNGTCGANFLP